MNKKVVAALIAACVSMSLVGCGSASSTSTAPQSASDVATGSSVTPASSEPEIAELEATPEPTEDPAPANPGFGLVDYNPAESDLFNQGYADYVDVEISKSDILGYDPNLYSEYYKSNHFDFDALMCDLGYRRPDKKAATLEYLYTAENWEVYVWVQEEEVWFGLESNDGQYQLRYDLPLTNRLLENMTYNGDKEYYPGSIEFKTKRFKIEADLRAIAAVCKVAENARYTRDPIQGFQAGCYVSVFSPDGHLGDFLSRNLIQITTTSDGPAVSGPEWFVRREHS
ncbi:hypothetical protein IJJ18_00525 [Candidatus Saccharibacteria bacterium]|nr:hypothetical protein [Candidatus Saccharibacteria bacterium]